MTDYKEVARINANTIRKQMIKIESLQMDIARLKALLKNEKELVVIMHDENVSLGGKCKAALDEHAREIAERNRLKAEAKKAVIKRSRQVYGTEEHARMFVTHYCKQCGLSIVEGQRGTAKMSDTLETGPRRFCNAKCKADYKFSHKPVPSRKTGRSPAYGKWR